MSTRSFLIAIGVVAALAGAVFYLHGPGGHKRMRALHATLHGSR